MSIFDKVIPSINGNLILDGNSTCFDGVLSFYGGWEEVSAVFCERVQREGYNRGSFVIKHTVGNLPKGAYKLEIADKQINVVSFDKYGFVNALSTLYQVLNYSNTLPCGTVEDYPKFDYRGIMVDVCRHFFNVAELKKIIEQCSLAKINVVRLHLSDDQGYRLQSKAFPLLNSISSWRRLSPQDPLVVDKKAEAGDIYGGYYTFDQIADLLSFAESRGVTIVPSIDVPGHSSAILAAYPYFTCSGKPLSVKGTFGVHDRIWCADNNDGIDFLQRLIDEVVEVFRPKFFHLGGDEVPKTEWKKCTRYQKSITKAGSTDALQASFVNRLCKYVAMKGITPIVWNDVCASGQLVDNAVAQYWTTHGANYMRDEVARGRKLILSDMNRFYCDYSYADIPMRATLNSSLQIDGVEVEQKQILGVEAPIWTEWITTEERLEQLLFPRLLAVAECAWNIKCDEDNFLQKAKNFIDNNHFCLLTPMPWTQATVSGDDALRQLAYNMFNLGKRYRAMTEFGGNEEDSGQAIAVGVDEAKSKLSPEEQTRLFLSEKMKYAYSPDDVGKVLKYLGELK